MTSDTSTPQAATLTLQALMDRYLKLHVLSELTMNRYDLVARNLARYMGGAVAHPSDIEIVRITEDVLLGFRDWSLRRMKEVSVRTECRHLSTLLNAAVRYQWIPANPMRGVPMAPVPRALPKALPRHDMHAYLDFVANARRRDRKGREVDALPPQWFWHCLLQVMYYTGVRRKQVVGLRWNDVDFQSKTIRLSAAASKTRREWLVPLPLQVVPALRHLQARTIEIVGDTLADRQVFCLPLFSDWSKNFVRKEMNAFNVDAFFRRLREIAPRHLRRLSSHRIRHTTATVLANSVPNLRLVQEQLGHQSITTTYGYVHPDLEAMRVALKAL